MGRRLGRGLWGGSIGLAQLSKAVQVCVCDNLLSPIATSLSLSTCYSFSLHLILFPQKALSPASFNTAFLIFSCLQTNLLISLSLSESHAL